MAQPITDNLKTATLPKGLGENGMRLAAAHGDRYSKRGKERLTFSGTSQTIARGPLAIRLIYELPGKVRYEETSGRGNSFVIAGPSLAIARSAADDDDDDLLESVFYDSPDYFFSTASEAATTPRYLGGRFRSPAGQFLDIYQMVVPLVARRDSAQRAKYYAFDSTTGLLSRVRSTTTRGNIKLQVETEWTEWRSVDNQQVPGRIRRLENGVERANVALSLPAFSPSAADNTFTRA